MVGWHHQLNGREFEQILGDGEGQGEACDAAVYGVTKNRTRLNNKLAVSLPRAVLMQRPVPGFTVPGAMTPHPASLPPADKKGLSL